ncbi:MAG: PSD1 and planctomycete cytochrome C domain-containing protein [Fuerstiella sp.]
MTRNNQHRFALTIRLSWILLLAVACWLVTGAEHCEAATSPPSDTVLSDQDAVDFARDVQPILADRCYACHGPDAEAREADLRLDVRESAVDLEAIVPGKPEASELVNRIFHEDADERMPPAEFKKPLTDAQKRILVQWIEQGAEFKKHWAFEPIGEPVPSSADSDASRSEIDRFVLARLKAQKIAPAPEANRATVLRRVTQDLTGLPPTLAERDAFLQDHSPDAYEKVVDRLLGSDDYAERMAAIWLDYARYADSNGYQFDNARTMWPWRDWVIRAYANNMPFDQFVTQQLAGDLLPDATQDQKIATGFNRNHGFTIEGGVIDEEYRVMYVNDKTTTAGTLFLGLTFECCRCHDHKYDPISTKEYYSLYAFFNSNAEGGVGKKGKPIQPAIAVDGGHVMIMQEKPRKTFVLVGGQFDHVGEPVQPDTPTALPRFGERPRNRLGLANWLTDSENPLLARVTVNRVWQQLFGVGLVKTVDNFGIQGESPRYPQLLDWLAYNFRDNDWDMHHLIRTIVLSETYRQSSKHRPNLEDSENRLLARGPSFRLPAEMIRDQALAVSGLLTHKVGGPSVKPYQPSGIWEDLNAPASHAEVYKQDTGESLYRKSMYTYWRRAAMHPAMAVFDAPNRDVCNVLRSTTNTPLQALALLHDPTYIEAARKLAELVLKAAARKDTTFAAAALRRVLSRTGTKREVALLDGLYRQRLAHYQSNPPAAEKLLSVGKSPTDAQLDRAQIAALADVCLAIFNLSETITRK